METPELFQFFVPLALDPNFPNFMNDLPGAERAHSSNLLTVFESPCTAHISQIPNNHNGPVRLTQISRSPTPFFSASSPFGIPPSACAAQGR